MLEQHQKPMFRYLAVLTAASMVGLQGYAILINNFAVETVHLEGRHIGIIQSVREVPGFLALTAVYVMMVVKEHRLSALSIALLGIGVGLTGLFPSFAGVAVTTLIMSFGFHYYETTNQSLTLQYFSTHLSPLVMGKLRSLAAIASIISAGIIWCLGGFMGYRGLFLTLGGVVFGLGIWALVRLINWRSRANASVDFPAPLKPVSHTVKGCCPSNAARSSGEVCPSCQTTDE